MSAGGQRLEGIKAYKGTMECAEQTLSFLITFIFKREEMWERRNWTRWKAYQEPRDLVIPSNVHGKISENRYRYTHPEGLFKENSMLFDFSPKAIMIHLICSHNKAPTPLLDSWAQLVSLLSIGGILEVGAEC